MSAEPAFAELVAASNFSFLDGASAPSDMVGTALALQLKGIGIADRNTVAGVVRAHAALRKARQGLLGMRLPPLDFKLAVGARLVFADGTPDIVAYPATRVGWGRLTRLLTVGNRRAEKGGCILRLDDLLAHHEDLLLIVMPKSSARSGESEPLSTRPPNKVPDCDSEPLPTSHPGKDRGPFATVSETEGRPRLTIVPQLDPGVDLRSPSARQGRAYLQPAITLATLKPLFPDRLWLGVTMPRAGRDRRQLAALTRIADAAQVPLLATADALYAHAGERDLHDVVTAIREGTTVQAAGRLLAANGERHIKDADEMARLFRDRPEAVANSLKLLDRIAFSLDELRYEYPHEPVPDGWLPQDWLEHIVERAAHERYGQVIPDKVATALVEEFALIRDREYAYYFLTVHDVVRYARSIGILCQGRGSAANSVVCFLLDVTSVDPMKHDLLFSRFVSAERNEPPDIDIDFEHERREEVMQYIYRRYGRDRAAIAATVIHYRPRSAVREVGKALGLTEDVTQRLTSTVWGSFTSRLEEERFRETGFDLANPEIARLKGFVDRLLDAPRHLSQHVGGFVLTQGRLDELVPIHNGAMEDRTFIEWDKDDIDALGLMKVDILALGMLTCIRKGFDLMRAVGLGDPQLNTIANEEDDAVYHMLQDGDSVGVFQVESRAQINMLPRLKPKEFYDLVVQVAIVRPGPIEGDMVHPYLRRRAGKEAVEFPSPHPDHGPPDELKQLLRFTYGVPLFQEQAMKLAIVAAEFTPDEANQLRRAMATFRHVGGMEDFKAKLVGGMVRRGYDEAFAERCYSQIEGFGSYGFPESHALSFARLVYVSAWLKCFYPAVFGCAILNAQPMGFYAPAQLVGDAREHGVEVKPVDVNASGWNCALEPVSPGWANKSTRPPNPAPRGRQWDPAARRDRAHAVRLGLRQVDGFRETWANLIDAHAPFATVEDLARHLPPRALRLLADADALGSLGMDRRTGGWEVRRTPPAQLPLFAAAVAPELGNEPDAALPAMPAAEHVAADYQLTRLSLKGHPMQFLRPLFAAEGILSSADANALKDGRRARVAGVVLVRQRPGKGNAIFVTIEDETGVTNGLLWARDFEANRRAIMAARLLVLEGVIQRSEEGVVHLMAAGAQDRTDELRRLSSDHVPNLELSRADVFQHPIHSRRPDREPAVQRGHPRDVRVLPPSRDFH